MATKVEQWQARDGKVFATEAEADAHDRLCDEEARVDAVFPELGKEATPAARRARKRERNTVLRFFGAERHRATLKDAGDVTKA